MGLNTQLRPLTHAHTQIFTHKRNENVQEYTVEKEENKKQKKAQTHPKIRTP